jgi:hypothetical protein
MATYDEVTSALGEMNIAFQALENEILELFSQIAYPNDEMVGIIVGSHLSFTKLVDVVDATCRYRTKDTEVLEHLSVLIKKCSQIEPERNTYTHSFYDLRLMAGDRVEFQRIKSRLKRGKGYTVMAEEFEPEKARTFAQRMHQQTTEIDDFRALLRGKGIIPTRDYSE